MVLNKSNITFGIKVFFWLIIYFNPIFFLNLGSWFVVLSSKLIILSYSIITYYTNLNSSIICCLFSGDISFGISISSSICECSFFGNFEILIISSAILLPIESPTASAVSESFWGSFQVLFFYEAVFVAFVVDFFRFLSYCLNFCSCF